MVRASGVHGGNIGGHRALYCGGDQPICRARPHVARGPLAPRRAWARVGAWRYSRLRMLSWAEVQSWCDWTPKYRVATRARITAIVTAGPQETPTGSPSGSFM